MVLVRVVTTAALVFGLAAGAHAGILYDNLGVATASSESVTAGPLYNSFTTDSGGGVNTVALLLDINGPPNPNGLVDVAIYANGVGDTPDGFVVDVGTVDDTSLSGAPSAVSFTGLGDALTPNTRYWIGLTDDTFPLFGTTSIDWARAADSSGTGVAGEFNADSTSVLPNGDGTGGTGQPFQMRVDAPAPAPEPASLSLLGLGLVGMAALRRRFR